jgi:hypothetical protein
MSAFVRITSASLPEPDISAAALDFRVWLNPDLNGRASDFRFTSDSGRLRLIRQYDRLAVPINVIRAVTFRCGFARLERQGHA